MTPDGWLDIGDLGFMRNQRIVVTGRVEDDIILFLVFQKKQLAEFAELDHAVRQHLYTHTTRLLVQAVIPISKIPRTAEIIATL